MPSEMKRNSPGQRNLAGASHLIIGYGNVDREDDGVAWHVLERVARSLNRPTPTEIGEIFPEGGEPAFLFSLQLVPEMAEIVSGYTKVCFVDAHTGAFPNDLQIAFLEPNFQSSPFTHHFTPQSLLVLSQTLYNKSPSSVLLSIRGYQFGFHHKLSSKTDIHANKAVDWILTWLKTSEDAD